MKDYKALYEDLLEKINTTEEILNCTAPMTKWIHNTSVQDFDSFKEWINSQVREGLHYQTMNSHDDSDGIREWVEGKTAAYTDILVNLHYIQEDYKQRLNQAYKERNILAAIACRLALGVGYKAGTGKDDNEDWDDEWRNVIYIDLPNGKQVSYHIAPDDLEVIENLPEYHGKWDGEFSSKDYETVDYVAAIPEMWKIIKGEYIDLSIVKPGDEVVYGETYHTISEVKVISEGEYCVTTVEDDTPVVHYRNGKSVEMDFTDITEIRVKVDRK